MSKTIPLAGAPVVPRLDLFEGDPNLRVSFFVELVQLHPRDLTGQPFERDGVQFDGVTRKLHVESVEFHVAHNFGGVEFALDFQADRRAAGAANKGDGGVFAHVRR